MGLGIYFSWYQACLPCMQTRFRPQHFKTQLNKAKRGMKNFFSVFLAGRVHCVCSCCFVRNFKDIVNLNRLPCLSTFHSSSLFYLYNFWNKAVNNYHLCFQCETFPSSFKDFGKCLFGFVLRSFCLMFPEFPVPCVWHLTIIWGNSQPCASDVAFVCLSVYSSLGIPIRSNHTFSISHIALCSSPLF